MQELNLYLIGSTVNHFPSPPSDQQWTTLPPLPPTNSEPLPLPLPPTNSGPLHLPSLRPRQVMNTVDARESRNLNYKLLIIINNYNN